jgi:hypothetical protein
MKKVGLVILAIGLILTLLSGIDFITTKKIVDIGSIAITQQKGFGLHLSPLIGFTLLALGAGVFLFGTQTNSALNITK